MVTILTLCKVWKKFLRGSKAVWYLDFRNPRIVLCFRAALCSEHPTANTEGAGL